MMGNIFLIGNSYHNVTQAAALIGYGYSVDEMRTLEAARVMLRAGMLPDTIIIDVKGQVAHVRQFIDFVRRELNLDHIHIVVIGANDREVNTAYTYGADIALHRPVDLATLIEIVNGRLVA